MELSWTTFVLEIINFLVLVFILQRFLYKPVIAVLEARQKRVQEALAQAESSQRHAEMLKDQYESRLQKWEKERESLRQELRDEIETERHRQLAQLREELAKEREKDGVLALREAEQSARRLETRAIQQGARFAAKLLQEVADAHLEARLVDLAVKEMASMSEEQRETVRAAHAKQDGNVRVITTNPLEPDRRAALKGALESILGAGASCEFDQEPSLLAGVRLVVGPWILDVNLENELAGFVRSSNE